MNTGKLTKNILERLVSMWTWFVPPVHQPAQYSTARSCDHGELFI